MVVSFFLHPPPPSLSSHSDEAARAQVGGDASGGFAQNEYRRHWDAAVCAGFHLGLAAARRQGGAVEWNGALDAAG